MTQILYSIDGGGFQHVIVSVAPADIDDLHHAAHLVFKKLAAQGAPARGLITAHSITPA